MTDKKKAMLATLRENYCNISDALNDNDLKLSDFHEFLEDEDFQKGYDACQQVRDDYARSQLMSLIESGEKTAIIEYNKQLRQSGDIAEAKMIRKKTMKILIEMAETKTKVLQEFCDIFKVGKTHAEDLFKEAIIEFKLITPHERQKIAREERASTLKERFNNGDLSEIDMLKAMMSDALDTSENAEYPSERSSARRDVLDIQRRLDEIQERENNKSKMSASTLFERIDSAVFDAPIEKIKEAHEHYNKLETTAPAFLTGDVIND